MNPEATLSPYLYRAAVFLAVINHIIVLLWFVVPDVDYFAYAHFCVKAEKPSPTAALGVAV